MRTAKPFLLGFVLVAATLLLVEPARTLRADPPPLTEVEKGQINDAIDQGVLYLRRNQGPKGTWDPKGTGPHRVSYAALPGLVLLECGAEPTDPAVKAAARYVRGSLSHIDTTYELSLAILFLDRLGDPQDEERIQRLAVRLIVGQTATGGWGYRCPLPSPAMTREILDLLRNLDPPRQPVPGPLDVLVGKPEKPDHEPGLARPDRRLVGLVPLLGALTGNPVRPEPIQRGRNPQHPPDGLTRPGAPAEDGISTPPSSDTASPGIASPGSSPGGTLFPPPESKEPRSDKSTPDRDGDPQDKKAKPDQPVADPPPALPAAPPNPGAAAKPAGPVPNAAADANAPMIPNRLQRLPVFMDPNRLGWVDLPKREQQPTFATTDNSNSQFALLALWVAQRHNVPMKRSLGLLVRRYRTSQNLDGTWSYHYRLGGEATTDRKPMTCVGLLGLAVGHGLAHDGQGLDQPAQGVMADPQILNGFLALSKNLGRPARGQMGFVPIENLYFLWSVERVAVLYNLPSIGDLDWYRWGAQILIANQSPPGCWLQGGGYYGAEPIVNTCLALLFLKRTNFAKDLGRKLDVDPRLLNAKLLGNQPRPADPIPPAAPPPARPDEGLAKQPDPVPTPAVAEKPAPVARAEKPEPIAQTTTAEPNEPSTNKKRGPLILLLVLGVLLLGGGLFLILWYRKRSEEEEDKKPAKAAKKTRTKKARASSP